MRSRSRSSHDSSSRLQIFSRRSRCCRYASRDRLRLLDDTPRPDNSYSTRVAPRDLCGGCRRLRRTRPGGRRAGGVFVATGRAAGRVAEPHVVHSDAPRETRAEGPGRAPSLRARAGIAGRRTPDSPARHGSRRPSLERTRGDPDGDLAEDRRPRGKRRARDDRCHGRGPRLQPPLPPRRTAVDALADWRAYATWRARERTRRGRTDHRARPPRTDRSLRHRAPAPARHPPERGPDGVADPRRCPSGGRRSPPAVHPSEAVPLVPRARPRRPGRPGRPRAHGVVATRAPPGRRRLGPCAPDELARLGRVFELLRALGCEPPVGNVARVAPALPRRPHDVNRPPPAPEHGAHGGDVVRVPPVADEAARLAAAT